MPSKILNLIANFTPDQTSGDGNMEIMVLFVCFGGRGVVVSSFVVVVVYL